MDLHRRKTACAEFQQITCCFEASVVLKWMDKLAVYSESSTVVFFLISLFKGKLCSGKVIV